MTASVLDRRLQAGEMVVEHSRPRLSSLRPSLLLRDGWVLRLHLYSQERRPFVSIRSIRWQVGLGWVVLGTAPTGDAITCHAWRASLTPPV